MAYGNIGVALYSLSRYDEALEYHKKNLEIAQQTGKIDQSQLSISKHANCSFFSAGDKSGEGTAYCNIGEAVRRLSRYDEAIAYQKKYLEIAQQTGEIDQSQRRIPKSNLARFFNAGDVVGEGNAHNNISLSCKNSGDIKAAIEHMQQAHACYVQCFGAEHSEAVDAQERLERLGGV
jgi:tetratricopeptide (TPR) repeat protein